MIKVILGVVMTLFAGAVSAATVNISIEKGYEVISNYNDCYTPELCQNFLPEHGVSGTFTTSDPLPANMAEDIHTSVASWRFSNGLDVFSSTDPQARLTYLYVETDAAGNITGIVVNASLWLTGSKPHSTGDRVSFIQINYNKEAIGKHNFHCGTVGSFVDVEDYCLGSSGFSGASHASGAHVSFETINASTPLQPVPTLSEWGLVIMAILLGLFGVFYLPKMQKPVTHC